MRAFRLSLFICLISVVGLRAAPAATITGHVIDPDGRAFPGAHVIVRTSIGTVADTATDASGAFALQALAAGTYELRVIAEGFETDARSIVLTEEESRDLSIALRISALSESVVVSASQVDVPLSRAADTVTVITGADLETRQIETASDALRLVPGLTVTRSGGRGAITSLFPRGGSSNYTLVLVDGIRANSFGGGYDFAHLSVANVDRVEIVRDPESALFGSDAIGAVVQIVTRRGGPPHVGGLVEGGGQGTAREAFDASGSHGNWTWGAGGEHTQSDGFTGIAPATGERVSNDDYHLSHVSGSLGYQTSNGPDFLVTGNIGRDERGFPGPYGSNPIGAYTAVDRVSRGIDDTRQIGGRFAHPWSPRVRERIEADYTDLAGSFTSPFGPSNSGTRRFDGRIQEDVALSSSFGGSAGIEFQRESGSSSFITGATADPIPIHRAILGAFGELRYAWSERLFVTGGLRVEHITRDALEGNPDGFPPRPPFPDQTVDSVNPKIAVSYLLTEPGSTTSTRLRASAGTGIRPPDAFEIAFTNNPNLLPERSRSIDAGIEQQFAGGAVAFAITGFYNRYDDLIVAVGKLMQDASIYQTDNIANARSRGFELSGSARALRQLTVHANYTYLDTENLSVDGTSDLAPPPFKVGDPLIRRPRHQGVVDLTYAIGRVTAFGELLARSQILDVEPTFGAFGGLFWSPGYSVITAGASVRVTPWLDVYARVLNLADRAYEETLGYPALRRTGMVGVRVAAGR